MLVMNSIEQLKLDVIGKLSGGKITYKQAIQILNKSESTIFRYLREYEAQGSRFALHRNKKKAPINKTDTNLEERIIELCKEKYKNFNRTHAWEEILANEDIRIPKTTFNNICCRNNLLNKNKKKRSCQNKYRRPRMKKKGIMLQLDGSPHRWFGHKKSCLVAIIDDATSDILYGEFSPTETTFACMNVIKHVLKQYGTFQILYTDRAGIFGKDPINHFDAVKREGFSSLKECLLKFKINTIYAYSPEAKGRIERAFRTLQDRLVAELEFNGIKTIKEANDYLNNVYLKKHRERFAVNPADSDNGFTPLLGEVDLYKHFYMKECRKIKNDHSFNYNGNTIDLKKTSENYVGKTLEIRSYPDGQVRYFIDDKEVELKQESKIAI